MDTYEKDMQVTKKLFETSTSISAEQVWEKEMNYKVTKAEWEDARIAKAKDSLEYSMARAQLQKQYLIAPFDGEIVAISKNPSESVEALEPIIEIADVRTCRMTAYIIVSKASSLKVGQDVSLQLNSGKIRNKKGKIEFISPVVDKASLLRTVKVVFENSDKSVEPGVTGKIFVK
jgi:multidrug efflux pump subunit AcrA (membrane-fusion protein)